MNLSRYLAAAADAMTSSVCSIDGMGRPLDVGVHALIEALAAMGDGNGTCWLFGNGGSGSVADHIATDMVLKGWRAIALTNPAAVTTMSNDYGFHRSFTGQLKVLADDEDILIGMSCSGESQNVINAMAEAPGRFRVALTGFAADNQLRAMPLNLQFWTPSVEFGAVQIAHLTLLHAVVDLAGVGA